MKPSVILSDFTPMRPCQEIPQETLIEEMTNIFALVQCATRRPQSQEDANRILAETKEIIRHYGVSPDHIKQRGFNTMVNVKITNNRNNIYPNVIPQPLQQPSGLPLGERMKEFEKVAIDLLEKHYADCNQAPDDIIHVTCTGYMSPSPVQRFLSRNNWRNTTVMHSYQMGCCGAFSSVRSANDSITTSFVLDRPKSRIDIFHTEYCSLHSDFQKLAPENILIMTLFGDGFIHYSVFPEDNFDAKRKNGLKILSIDEQILPGSEEGTTLGWGQHHIDMTLSPDVPSFVDKYIEDFAENVLAMAGRKLSDIRNDLIFAIHPGGPKILDLIQERLRITRKQMRHSWDILYKNGNMVSATTPYVWHAIVNDDTVPKGKLVLSLAFGPGLTASGMLMEKV
uniref:Predicted naringenin-chalcone synthase n=1 Tax=Candidatus Kentrum sp. TC TaxID=2126339 RepID=A0A450ZZ68_9GAMM|nr:MAG: Predicted naringenin-chalcone synthase [Candidatus Kentron sp. TC]